MDAPNQYFVTTGKSRNQASGPCTSPAPRTCAGSGMINNGFDLKCEGMKERSLPVSVSEFTVRGVAAVVKVRANTSGFTHRSIYGSWAEQYTVCKL